MTSNVPSVLVVGGSGFIGQALLTALRSSSASVETISAPRLTGPFTADADYIAKSQYGTISQLADKFADYDVVVNAAGSPDAGSANRQRLLAANAELPCVLAHAAGLANVRRFIHVSSAAVQGRKACLDESDDFQTFSEYSNSKMLGERLVAASQGPKSTTIYRPAGVHGRDRQVTSRLAKIARSPLSSVAGRGQQNTPQALIENVANALAFLANTTSPTPKVVMHPSEGLTVRALLRLLGDREPWAVPPNLARTAIATMRKASAFSTAFAPHARRVEMIMFGQEQGCSWLTSTGWVAPHGLDHWKRLGRLLRLEQHSDR